MVFPENLILVQFRKFFSLDQGCLQSTTDFLPISMFDREATTQLHLHASTPSTNPIVTATRIQCGLNEDFRKANGGNLIDRSAKGSLSEAEL